MLKIKGSEVQLVQGGGEIPFAKQVPENPCPEGEHAERIYFPEVPPGEESPAKRLAKLKEAGNDPFEAAAVEHNIRAGHITHGRQISRGATKAEKKAGKKGDFQNIKAVCVKCGKFRELDHAANKYDVTECKNQEEPFGGTDQFKNNRTLAERGKRVSYKVPASQKRDKRMDTLRHAGFEVIFV
jgi:hypothetical protein